MEAPFSKTVRSVVTAAIAVVRMLAAAAVAVLTVAVLLAAAILAEDLLSNPDEVADILEEMMNDTAEQ